MSVNLLPKYRVIAIVTVVCIAFSALAWSGGRRLQPASVQGSDSIPSRSRPAKKAPKHKKHVEEGRVARELDLRMDVDDTEGMPEIPDLDAPNNMVIDLDMPAIDMDALNDLNAQFGPPPIPDRIDIDALDELKDMVIGEDDLQTLKDLNIDEEIWNELRALKEQMDDLRSELEEEQANGINDYRLHREAEAIMEAVRAEMPRVRKEVQKTLEEYNNPKLWQ
ncbi:MAG: hypothetical protein BGO55_20580 [Sphingobacteriales bacterium 50-39]|nr:hypothetical protein [Sphingobacteriales bacterium]OJW59086.1 MAG: hypothetical protein BGO55_20580 [Sphingobacteriales bacterium 50-39]